ncbi:hypothetical protein U9M48_026792 [Paspalum notatum var. saurae]|uniref:Uncharacterized protein n=1 Tax=Paspalum notatum var. saurae TaxID=547442 RepID=A0AAQ3TRM9_PASNO
MAAAASSSSSSEVRVATRRIVDYLNDGEELGVEGAAEAPPCSPAAAAARSVRPRFRWPRLVSFGRKGAARKGVEVEVEVEVEREEAVVETRDGAPVAVSTSARESAPASGTKHSDLGVGLSLVFLLAKTSDEFNKMAKVREEMEALLREIKDGVRVKGGGTEGHDASRDRNRESTTSSCVTDGNDQSASDRLEYRPTSSGAVPAASYVKSFEDGGCCARMEEDVLEEEFHAEMERLQVNYGSETPSFLPEEEDHFSEPYDEMAEYRDGVDDDSGEIVEDEDDDDDDHSAEYNGVSAVELERRLHELLHERNRDRIEELEAALRRAEKKLVEKEMEVSLWKDTAKFALRQDNELQ